MDVVAVTVVSDVMPLVEENRIIVSKGLKILRDTKNDGLMELLKENECSDRELNVYDLGFIISPRLNAAGRLEDANTSLELLWSKAKKARAIVKKLEELNRKRQSIQARVVDEILLDGFEDTVKDKKIFIGRSKTWEEGVIGIAASILSARFQVPVILFSQKDGLLKGSGRSTKGFDLYESLKRHSSLYTRFGGHQRACGLSMIEENYLVFKSFMERALQEPALKIISQKVDDYELEIGFDEITDNFLGQYHLLEPFGESNPEPVFMTKNVLVSKKKSLKEGKHLKLTLVNNSKSFEAIFFNIDERKSVGIRPLKDPYTVIYTIRKSLYRGKVYIQLVIYDIF
jgi:single-stranded-DNA-specific exonuclease